MRSRAWLTGICLASVAGLLLSGGTALAEGDEPPAPWLGVRLIGAKPPEEGTVVSRVFVDSPADRAGLRARDVIVGFGGQPVTGVQDLIGQIRTNEPGAWIPMTVLRQGDELELDVRLGKRPEKIEAGAVRRGWIGLESIDLPEKLRVHFGAPPEAGVMISNVIEGSPAEAAGFRVGDVVYEAGDKPVKSRGVLRELVAGGGVGNEYEFSVSRDGALIVLESEIDAAPPKKQR